MKAILNIRLEKYVGSEWVFPPETLSGHIEPSSLKKQHIRALWVSGMEPLDLYTVWHTCPTRWAPHMDPWTLAHLAGHRDMNITKRYVHPQEHKIRATMERARYAQGGHKFGHTVEKADVAKGGGTAAIN